MSSANDSTKYLVFAFRRTSLSTVSSMLVGAPILSAVMSYATSTEKASVDLHKVTRLYAGSGLS